MLIFLLGSALVYFVSVKFLIWTGVFVVAIIIPYYIHLKNRNSYFAKKGIPHPPIDSLFLGNLPEFEKGLQQHLKLVEWEKTYGDTYGIYEGSHKIIVSSDPELINDVLVKQFYAFRSRKTLPSVAIDQENDKRQNLFLAEGNRWKRLRALISASLTINQIKSIEPIMHGVMWEMMEVMEEKRIENPDGIIDFKPELMNMGFAVISRCALSFSEPLGHNEKLQILLDAFSKKETVKSWSDSFFASTYEFLPVTKYLNMVALFSAVVKIIKFNKRMGKIIERRERETEEEKNTRGKDLIDFLMNSKVDSSEIQDSQKAILDSKVQKKLTQEELASTCVMFLIAGTDTTANTTGFLLYDLAAHKDIQRQVYEEIESNIFSDEDMTYHKIRELEFLDRVIKESSRLHPIVSTVVARRAREDAVITKSDGSKLVIEKGVSFMPNIISLHMNEKIWGPNPEKFDPDRFLPENSTHRSVSDWLSFGAGPRSCPGAKLAMYEMKIAIINILKKYKVDICDKTDLKAYTGTLLSLDSMWLKLTKRT